MLSGKGCLEDLAGRRRLDAAPVGFEYHDQIVGLAGGVDVAVVEVGAEVVEPGRSGRPGTVPVP